MVPAIITGLSFYTIPSWATENYEVVANVTKGTRAKEYRIEDSAKIVQWLPMVFVFPFKSLSEIPKVPP